MATKKSKKTDEKKSSKPKVVTTKTEKIEKVEAVATVTTKKSENPFKGFFAKKSGVEENILTIFKSPKIWGAILGELVGTMLLTMLMLTLGVYQPLYVMIGMIAITMAVYAFSGANLNPAITVGMMATRRISAIRGVLYIIAQFVGAWIGLVILSGFRVAGNNATDLPAMTAIAENKLMITAAIELLGAVVIGYFFCRAQVYKTPRGAFTYAAIVAGGLTLAVLFAVVISSNYVGLSKNFALNPAVATMQQIFPSVAENFGQLMSAVGKSMLVYIIVPMVGAVLGFFISDISSKLSEEE